MAKLSVKNWREFQHYKERNPIWIKLHRKLLDDFEYHRLPLASRALAPMLWLLASESQDGSIEYDVEKIAFRLHTTSAEIKTAITPLISSSFFMLEQDASDALAGCKQHACPETETETETESPPTPSDEGESKQGKPRKKKRRTRTDMLAPYPAEVVELVNSLIEKWPERQPGDKSVITVDVPKLAERIDAVLKEPNVTRELIENSAAMYLSESKRYYKHPQFFFGTGGNGESAHWSTYARMLIHQQSKVATQ